MAGVNAAGVPLWLACGAMEELDQFVNELIDRLPHDTVAQQLEQDILRRELERRMLAAEDELSAD